MSTAPRPYDERIAWFHEARFGLFIHWGLYSLLERGEWVMFHERIPRAEYEKLADQFTGERFDAGAWARLAKDAGMRYAILTTRHHEGFCLWDSDVTDYTSVKTGAGRDFVREFVEAFRAEGLGIGFYISDKDWRQPGYFEPERYPESRYAMVDELHAMTKELLSNYGTIDVLWFDGSWIDVGRKTGYNQAEFWRAPELLAEVYRLQPGILVNNRIGVPADLDTPEQHIAESEAGRGWETCMTVGDSAAWGYARHNPNRKSLAQLLQNLSRTAAGAGNFLLNVGPRGDGSIPEEDALRLREIGAWLDVHGEAIYGSQRLGEKTANHFQGVFSRKGNTVYLHVFRWSSPEIVIPLLKSTPRTVSLLTTGAELPFRTASNGRLVISGLPTFPPHHCQSVIKLEFDREPERLEEPDHAAWLAP